MNFKALYKNSTVEEKLKFLEEIIRHNEELQQAFVNFSNAENSPDKDISPQLFLVEIEKTRKQYLEYFEAVDTENPDRDSYQLTLNEQKIDYYRKIKALLDSGAWKS